MFAVKKEYLLIGVLVLVIFFGIVLRLWVVLELRDYWFDEAVTAGIVDQPLLEGWKYLRYENTPPLYFFVLRLWSEVFGNSEMRLRLLSLVAAFLAFPAMYILGSTFFNRRVGAISAALVGISSTLIFHQTEARMYSLFFLLTIISLYFFWRVTRGNASRILYLGYFIFTLAALYTHLSGLILIAVEGIYLFRIKPAEWKKILSALSLCGLLFIPWLLYFLKNLAEIWSYGLLGSGWYFSKMQGQVPYLLEMPVGFFFELTIIPAFTIFLMVLIAVALFFSIFDFAYNAIKRIEIGLREESKKELFFLLFLFLIPILLSSVTLNLPTVRYYLPSAIAFFLLLANGIDQIYLRYSSFLLAPISIMSLALVVSLAQMNTVAIVELRQSWSQIAQFARLRDIKDIIISPSEFGGLLAKRYLGSEFNVIIPFINPVENRLAPNLDYLNLIVRYNWNWMSMNLRGWKEAEIYKEALDAAILNGKNKFVYIYQGKPKEIFFGKLIKEKGYACADSVRIYSRTHSYRAMLFEKNVIESPSFNCLD